MADSYKIANYKWIMENFSVGETSNRCPTKTQILSLGLLVNNETRYAASQLVRQIDIAAGTYIYTFAVGDWNKVLSSAGGVTTPITITSYKKRGNEASIPVGWSIDASTLPSWATWKESDMTFNVERNTTTSVRIQNIYFEQDESGSRDYASLSQTAAASGWNYYFSVNTDDVSFPYTADEQSIVLTSYKIATIDGVETGGKVLVDFTATTPSWITDTKTAGSESYTVTLKAAENTATIPRASTVTFTQSESNGTAKTVTVNVGQAAVAEWTYTFTITDWQKNIGAVGGTTSAITVNSYKSRGTEKENLSWSIDTNTKPSWITWNASDRTFTVAENTDTASRSQKVYFVQAESGKRDYAEVIQSAVGISYNYYFRIVQGSATSMSFTGAGGTKSTLVESYKRQVINGVEQVGSEEFVLFQTNLHEADWINYEVGDVQTGTNTKYVALDITAAEQLAASSRSMNFDLIQPGSGNPENTITIPVIQSQVEYEFGISWVNGGPYIESISTTYPYVITSADYKTFYIRSKRNGKNYTDITMASEVDWIKVTSTTNLTYSIDENTSTSSRTGRLVLTQAGSSKKCYINITQEAKANEFVFKWTDDTTSKQTIHVLGNVPGGFVTMYNGIISTLNGLDVAYTTTKPSWVTTVEMQGDLINIYCDKNAGTERTGTITFTQTGSNSKLEIEVIQAASNYEYIYAWGVPAAGKNTWVIEVNSNEAINTEQGAIASTRSTDGFKDDFEAVDFTYPTKVEDMSLEVEQATELGVYYIRVKGTTPTLPGDYIFTLTQTETNKQLYICITVKATLSGTFSAMTDIGQFEVISGGTVLHPKAPLHMYESRNITSSQDITINLHLYPGYSYWQMLNIKLNGVEPKIEVGGLGATVEQGLFYLDPGSATAGFATTGNASAGAIEAHSTVEGNYAAGALMSTWLLTWPGFPGAPIVHINCICYESDYASAQVMNISGAKAYVGSSVDYVMPPTLALNAGTGEYVGLDAERNKNMNMYASYGYPGSGQSSQEFGLSNIRVGGNPSSGSNAGRLAVLSHAYSDPNADYLIRAVSNHNPAVSTQLTILGDGRLQIMCSRNSGYTYPAADTLLSQALVQAVDGKFPDITISIFSK